MATATEGFEAFSAHYGSIYGLRWPSLLEHLKGASAQVGLGVRPQGGFSIDEDAPDGMYRMDEASLEPALALDLPEKGEILDACAAPGGKTLILASRVADRDIRIVANEYSSDRRRRLGEVLDSQLPEPLRRKVAISGEDAAAMCRRNLDRFDAILLDAPCSSERHVLASASALREWTPARSRNLARRQWALLSSAFLMLKPGGCLIYSTCSISPLENGRVVERIESKYPGRSVIVPAQGTRIEGEASSPGRLILPDACRGAGPMYWAKIVKAKQGG